MKKVEIKKCKGDFYIKFWLFLIQKVQSDCQTIFLNFYRWIFKIKGVVFWFLEFFKCNFQKKKEIKKNMLQFHQGRDDMLKVKWLSACKFKIKKNYKK